MRVSHGWYSLPIGEAGRLEARRLVGAASHTTAANHWGWKVKHPPMDPHVTVRRKRHLRADVVGAGGQAAEDALIDAFLAYIFLFMAVIACGFVVASVLRLRAEEEAGRTEVVLATPVSRTSWMAATTALALIAAAKLTVLMGLGLAVGYGLGSGEWDQVLPQVAGQLAYLPGTLVVGALAVALYGLFPRGTGLAWAAVALIALQVILGQLLGLPDAVQAISPFWHLAAVPVDDFEVVPYVSLVLLAAALVAAGLWGYRRRDAVAG